MCRPEVSSFLLINHHTFRGHTTWVTENVVKVTADSRQAPRQTSLTPRNLIDFSFIVFILRDASLWRNILLRLRPTCRFVLSSGTGNCLTSWWESVNRERASERERERHAPGIHLLSRTVRSVDIDRLHKYTSQAGCFSVATECVCAQKCVLAIGRGQIILTMRCKLLRDNALKHPSGM